MKEDKSTEQNKTKNKKQKKQKNKNKQTGRPFQNYLTISQPILLFLCTQWILG